MATVPSTSPGARFIDPKLLARVGSLELAARFVVEGFINGLHKAPYLGVSIDFAEHRGYMPGDDIRRIDWRLFARTDRFYVKQFEADTNTNFSVLFDVSKSMNFGSRGLTKLDSAAPSCVSIQSSRHHHWRPSIPSTVRTCRLSWCRPSGQVRTESARQARLRPGSETRSRRSRGASGR